MYITKSMGENNIDIVVTESHAVIRNCLCWLGHVCPGVLWNVTENLTIGRMEKTKKNPIHYISVKY